MVGALQSEKTVSDLFVGAESVPGRCFCAAQCSFVLTVPGWGSRLGVWFSSVQTGALPVECEHVRFHLPDLPDELGPLDGCHKAFSFSENANQTLPAGPPAGGLGDGVHLVTADAFLPQVSEPKIYFTALNLIHFYICKLDLKNKEYADIHT